MRGRIEAARLAWGVLAVAMIAAAIVILYFNRSTTLWIDDWSWALGRRSGIHSLLESYNGHFSLVPILIYRALFATAGVSDYLPYRIVGLVGHLVCVTLVFVYVRRRLSDYLALLAALLLLFLGPAWQDILWPFQIAWFVSVAAGVGALLMLDRRDRLGDVVACLGLLVSIASSSVGVAVLIGAIIEVASARRRWRAAWIVAIPAVVYAAWSIPYQHTTIMAPGIFVVTPWMAGSVAAAFATPLGLSQASILNDTGTILQFGVPLAVAGLGLLLYRCYRLGYWPARAFTLAAIALSFWAFTAVGRAFLGDPYASRYLYVSYVFVLLFVVELAPRLPLRPWLAMAFAVVAAAAIVANLGPLRDSGGYLRGQARLARADLAMLDLDRGSVPSAYVATAFPGYPFLRLQADQYFAMERSIGTPAYSVRTVATAPEDARAEADTELIHILGAALVQSSSRLVPGPRPVIEQASGGLVRTRGSCDFFTPGSFTPSGVQPQVALRLAGGGIRVSTGGQAATVGLRRFADAFLTVGSLAPHSAAALRLAPDAASQPWHVLLSVSAPVTVCGLA